VFFDTLRIDIERANRPLVEAVDRVVTSRGKASLAARAAKAIAVLQLVEGFPVSQANVAAVLYPGVGAKPPVEEVQAAIKELLADKALPLTEIDGSLRFMSAAVSVILTEKQTLQPATGDVNRIIADQLRECASQIFPEWVRDGKGGCGLGGGSDAGRFSCWRRRVGHGGRGDASGRCARGFPGTGGLRRRRWSRTGRCV